MPTLNAAFACSVVAPTVHRITVILTDIVPSFSRVVGCERHYACRSLTNEEHDDETDAESSDVRICRRDARHDWRGCGIARVRANAKRSPACGWGGAARDR